MPYKPLAELDMVKLENTSKVLCDLFKVSSLHPHQSQTGYNTLRGISTVLDIPTGGGKTLAFWYPLFYYWAPGNIDDDCQKIVLVVGPLTALMEFQAIGLAQKGNLAENKYRVTLISPEMATSSKFHSTVLSSDLFCNNIISLFLLPVVEELDEEEATSKCLHIEMMNVRIGRWHMYRAQRLKRPLKMDYTRDPWALLLMKLAGINSPQKAQQAFQQYMHESCETEILLAVTAHCQTSMEEDGVLKASKKTNTPFCTQVACELFTQLSATEQAALHTRAAADAKAAKEAYQKSLRHSPSKAPEDRQW
ncbi:hypothetical protein DFH07DRAFT_969146 [Mycena maculata]|uniref:DEAD/DEAH-box helicase domain-containing protein n=1 Tax=Mycena maculata TaxID=230809 RepID=A0AAD7HYV0_9AGAR|nr:hypothetical protein DFH07DRAFT_969146 [Mycena maculata]